MHHFLPLLAAIGLGSLGSMTAESPVEATRREADRWRAEHRLIDVHQHLRHTPAHLARAVKIMDAVGVGVAVDLGTGTTTPGPDGGPSEFERLRRVAEAVCPGRILHYLTLDYHGWDDADWSERAVRQIEEGHRLGAAGLKEFKRLGLYLRDGAGRLLRVDDPKLDPVWRRCGELGLPVSIHVADPKAFWLPYDSQNERWKELKDHPQWWFGDAARFPAWKDLLESLNRVVARHPATTFVAVHFANNAEELDWVDASLSRYPNLMADLAARIPELGRHDPDRVRQLFLKHQDRLLFGTDFQVHDRLILGSSGDEPPPTDADAMEFFAKHGRWLETNDRDWAHMTPIQGDWTIHSIGLPPSVLRKIYFDNARRLLARSLPLPRVKAKYIESDWVPDGKLDDPVWRSAESVYLESSTADASVRPDLSTLVRVAWSARYLYLSYECPFTRLTVFEPARFDRQRHSLPEPNSNLWDRDVVEAFINADPADLRHYREFQVAPTNERLDLSLRLPSRDFEWKSGFESAVTVDETERVWRCELRIPLSALSDTRPADGTRWRLNFFRCDRAGQAFLAWNPTLTPSFHVPERFGVLEFVR